MVLKFPEPPKEEYAFVYLEETDRPLPSRIDSNLRYAYFKTIAKGGKSLIKACKDLHLSRVICYKTLRPEIADDPLEQQRFVREARVSAMLQHPNTVPTYELGRDNHDHYYFTMKLVHGYTLREIFDYRERYTVRQLVDVLVQIGYALDYAHNHGVAHRDIKPENILVGPFGEVLLLDWGLAKVWNQDGSSESATESAGKGVGGSDLSLTGQGELQGTVSYMSPEQVEKDPGIDFRTDIFSLGAVLYEVLAGRNAATGERIDQIVDSVVNGEPPLPSTVSNYDVPKFLEEITMQCIRKDPAARFQTMGELIRLLREDWDSD